MFIKGLKYICARIFTILLFFNDFKIIIPCFTILLATIFTLKSIEGSIFLGERVDFFLIFKQILKWVVPCVIFLVSQGVVLHVNKIGTIVIILLIATILISLQMHSMGKEKKEILENVQSFIGKNIEINGVILSEEGGDRYMLRSNNGSLGDVILKIPQYSVIQVGQSCLVSGILVQPKSFEDFDYKKYLFRKGIYSILEVNEYICSNKGNLLSLRSSIEKKVNKSLPEPESSLLVGILFGSERVFTKDFNNALQVSGLSHIVSASGYNVALLASFVDRVFGKTQGRGIYILKISLIWFFAFFSGFSSSIVRASTMSTIYFFALLLGRDVSKGILILFCITVLIVLNPFVIHDIGFLLSSSSTVGLIFFPKCFKCKSRWIEQSFLPTFTCALFTLPVVIYFFGKISVVSIASNILAAPVIQSTIYWGIFATVFNLFSNTFHFLYFFAYVQLNIFRYIVEISSLVNPVLIHSNTEVFVYILVGVLFFFCLLKYPLSNENYYWKRAKGILKYTF